MTYPLFPPKANLMKIPIWKQVQVLSEYLVNKTGIPLSNDQNYKMANFNWAKRSIKKLGFYKCVRIIDCAWQNKYWAGTWMHSFKFMFEHGLEILAEAEELKRY